MADLRGRKGRPPPGAQIFSISCIGKICQNRMLATPLGSWRPLLGEILDPPLVLSVDAVLNNTKYIKISVFVAWLKKIDFGNRQCGTEESYL